MDSWHIGRILDQQRSTRRTYLEFLRRETMSAGLFLLAAGASDTQQPHAEDEVYVVLGGRATISVAGEDEPVQAGSVVFVGAEVEHRFHSVEEDLQVLVFFAPAESRA